MKEKPYLQIKVLFSPIMKKQVFKGRAEAVSSQNKLGKFDILPAHTNFITLIFNYLIIHTPEKKKVVYNFKKGVLETSENKVNVFLGL